MSEPEASKKPWWQFRLRSLLLVMLIVAAYFAGWSAAMRRVRQAEREAQQQLQKALRAEQQAVLQLRTQRAAAERNAAIARMQLERTRINKLPMKGQEPSAERKGP